MKPFRLPKPNTNYLKRSFRYSLACLCINLPRDENMLTLLGSLNELWTRYLTYRIPIRQPYKTLEGKVKGPIWILGNVALLPSYGQFYRFLELGGQIY